jgi:hypothetical protein
MVLALFPAVSPASRDGAIVLRPCQGEICILLQTWLGTSGPGPGRLAASTALGV